MRLGERRAANRYTVSMRMEIWPESAERGTGSKIVNTRDVSMNGVYFFSEDERAVGAKLNFSVLFLHQLTRQEGDLICGLARVVRCEPVVSAEAAPFGVAMQVEQTSYRYEG